MMRIFPQSKMYDSNSTKVERKEVLWRLRGTEGDQREMTGNPKTKYIGQIYLLSKPD